MPCWFAVIPHLFCFPAFPSAFHNFSDEEEEENHKKISLAWLKRPAKDSLLFFFLGIGYSIQLRDYHYSSNKSRSMASVLEIYYPISPPPLRGLFKSDSIRAWFCCFCLFFFFLQPKAIFLCVARRSLHPPFRQMLECLYICRYRAKPHMNCKKGVHTLARIKIKLKETKREKKMLMTCWTTKMLQSSSRKRTKAIKTLSKFFFFSTLLRLFPCRR